MKLACIKAEKAGWPINVQCDVLVSADKTSDGGIGRGNIEPIPIRAMSPPELRRFGELFAEAETLARIRSPHVVALLDVQPRHRFVALELCRGGNLRLAMRRGLLTRADVPAATTQLRLALRAVHEAGAVHRDVKPANILVREAKAGSPIALADFGIAVDQEPRGASGRDIVRAGTLRYLAPEIKAGAKATPATDFYAAGVVLLELAIAPAPLPAEFDRLDPGFDARTLLPELLERAEPTELLERLLSPDPRARDWSYDAGRAQ